MLSSTTSSVWLVTLTKNALIFKFSLYLCYFPKKKLSRTYDKEINEFQTIKKLVVFALSYHNHSYQQYGLFIDYIYNEYIYTLSISVSVLYERMDIPQSNSQNVLDLLRMRVILKLFLLSFMLSFQSSKLKLSSKYQLLCFSLLLWNDNTSYQYKEAKNHGVPSLQKWWIAKESSDGDAQ